MESGADVPGDGMHKGSKKPKPCREPSEAGMSPVGTTEPRISYVALFADL